MHRERFLQAELSRLLKNIVRVGTVKEVDLSGSIPLGKVEFEQGVVSNWLAMSNRRAGDNGSWDPFGMHEQVVVLCPAGDVGSGIIIAAINQSSYPSLESSAEKKSYHFEDGALIEYDRSQHHLKAVLPDGGTVEIVAPNGLTIVGDIVHTGNLASSGNIRADGDVSDGVRSMAGDRNIYNDHTHIETKSMTKKTGQQQ